MSYFFVAVLAAATYCDLKTRRIPNWLTYPFLVLGLFRIDSFYLLVCIFSIFTALAFGRLIGSGDIKLAAVISIWSHILSWSQYWIYAALIFGGIAGVIFRRKSLPFAPYMAAGVIAANVARSYGFI
jgi:prepilin signal peptidase PulO-like enzyme (type II secretory pathway)